MKSSVSKSLVSVLMPCYNHELYVKEAILSVLTQTHGNIELIVIDDGSTDGSWDVIESLMRVNKFTAIKRDNKGLILTLKELLAMATGDYITTLASDDRFYPSKVEVMLHEFSRNPKAGLCIGRADRIDEHGNVLGVVEGDFSGKGDLHSLLRDGSTYVSYVATLVNAEAYRQVNFFSNYIEDLPAWLQISRDWQVVVTNSIVGSHRKTQGSLSHNFERMIAAEKDVINHYMNGHATYPPGWCIRWLSTYMLSNPRKAVDFLFSKSCSPRIFIKFTFYKRLIRIAMIKLKLSVQ